MTDIMAFHSEEPISPASSQHPDAIRYPCSIGAFRFVDASGGAPTQAEMEAVLGLDAAGLATKARIEQDEEERAVAKGDGTMRTLIDQTRAEWADWAQANFPTLTVAERNRMGVICWLLAVSIRRLMR